MLLGHGGERHQGKFLLNYRTVGSGGEEAVSFPIEGHVCNPGVAAAANHLQENGVLMRHQHDKGQHSSSLLNMDSETETQIITTKSYDRNEGGGANKKTLPK